MKQKNKQIILVSWAHVDLCFTQILQEKYGMKVSILRYQHDKNWNTNTRSYCLNYLNIVKFSLRVIRVNISNPTIYFGHHLCRIFGFFNIINKRSYYVYNELPKLDNGIIAKYDRFLFKSIKNIYVSSYPRRLLLKKRRYDISNCQVVENITFTDIPNNSSKDGGRAILSALYHLKDLRRSKKSHF